ncbi:hypothetical protein HPP92_002826 [Vanilla planifolia]|uniref:Uncharacterized protein n=1 Tax=Vanilla planifolia TaxID=51239 RepID=A0A835S0M1_VANPL|nr:hypothetical protein HPP92_002826 [Vanilla planifolia]
MTYLRRSASAQRYRQRESGLRLSRTAQLQNLGRRAALREIAASELALVANRASQYGPISGSLLPSEIPSPLPLSFMMSRARSWSMVFMVGAGRKAEEAALGVGAKELQEMAFSKGIKSRWGGKLCL